MPVTGRALLVSFLMFIGWMGERNGRLQSQDSRFHFHIPLYRIVSKLRPWRLGSRNEFFSKSQVPSPTVKVLDEYELDPGGERLFAMAGKTCWGTASSEQAEERSEEAAQSSVFLRVQYK